MDRLKGKRECRWMDRTDNGWIGKGDRAQQSHGLGEVCVCGLLFKGASMGGERAESVCRGSRGGRQICQGRAVLHLSAEPSPHGWGTCLEKSHLECEEQTGHTLTGVKGTHSSHLLGKAPQIGLAGKVHKQVV